MFVLGFRIKATSGIREAALNGPKRETATPTAKERLVHLRSDSGQVKAIKKVDVESIVGGVYPVVGELETLSQAGRTTDMVLARDHSQAIEARVISSAQIGQLTGKSTEIAWDTSSHIRSTQKDVRPMFGRTLGPSRSSQTKHRTDELAYVGHSKK